MFCLRRGELKLMDGSGGALLGLEEFDGEV